VRLLSIAICSDDGFSQSLPRSNPEARKAGAAGTSKCFIRGNAPKLPRLISDLVLHNSGNPETSR